MVETESASAPLTASAAVVDATVPRTEAAPENRILLHMPVDVRSASLAVIAAVALVFVLQWASALFIPLMLGLVLSYALAPVVQRLERLRLSRTVATTLLMASLIGAFGAIGYVLRDDATQFAEGLPEMAQKITRTMQAARRGPESTLDKVQKAAAQLEQAAAEAAAPSARGVTRVEIAKAHFNLKDYLVTNMPGIAGGLGQAIVVLFVTFFLLASGSTFRRKLVKLAGPTLAKKKITVQALDEITEQIQRYLLVQLGVSVIVGILTGLALWALGLNNAVVWGIAAGVLNLVPYLGSVVVMATSALAAFLQFGDIQQTVLVAVASLVIHAAVGNLLVPWLTSRTSRMNPVVVFAGVLVWAGLWGVWGLLLGIPILMVIKAICDRVEDLQPIGELLGD